jgi:hypothetical protein
LGQHTVQAGRITYVGLYPVWLPYVRNNASGWISTITVRNNSSVCRAQVNTAFFNTDGTVNVQRTNSIAPNASATLALPSNFTGSAIVVSSEDVSVVAENLYDNGNIYLIAAYPGETAPATTVYVPYVVRRWYTGHPSWRQTTELIIQNAGSQSASVTVTFYDSWGSDTSGSHSVQRTVPANGQVVVSGTEMPFWESGASLAAARITSDQPIAVVATTGTGISNSGGTITTPYLQGSYRAFTSTGDKVYMPLTAREYYGYDSSPQVQNASGSTTIFRIKFYDLQGNLKLTLNNQTVGPYRALNYWRPAGLPANYLGGAVAEVTSGGPLVAMAQYDRIDTANSRYGVMQYEAVTQATQMNVLARMQKSYPWTYTGINAQNMGSSATTITLNFYYQSGNGAGSATRSNVSPNVAVNYWSDIPSINGSAVSNSAMPVALMVNLDRLGDVTWVNRDGLMGYGAVK